MSETPGTGPTKNSVDPPFTIEMRGPNLVIRSTAMLDDADAGVLTDAINAASATNVTVVIDPAPLHCGDDFAATTVEFGSARGEEPTSQSADVRAAECGRIQIPAEHSVWTIDLRHGRLCRSDGSSGGTGAWTPVVAVMITPQELTALTADGTKVTSTRAARRELGSG